ncbi:MAG: hypothetical protein WC429_24220, partial [Verrucomicrobiia bacterium]
EHSFELAAGEAPGAGFKLPSNFPFTGSDEEFEHLCVLLTYLHEQFHARHFTASPLGLTMSFIGGRQYAYISHYLEKWGERMAREPARELRLPLTKYHEKDPEIQQINQTRHTFSLLQFFLTGGTGNLTLGEAKDTVFPAFAHEMETLCRTALGKAQSYPDTRLFARPTDPVAIGALTGEAVIEGLARCNEFLTVALLDAPIEILNRYLVLKAHGVYKTAIVVLEKMLDVKAPFSWRLTAKLADWALHAPLLPFLLQDRDVVALEELLPAWRFFCLVSRFKQQGFTLSDLDKDERHVARVLFEGLGWENPWQVAQRIREAHIAQPKSILTRHYVETLHLGAVLRETDSAVLAYPNIGDQGHRLGALYNIFPDRIAPGTTGKLTSEPNSHSVIISVLSDATVDALLQDANLRRSLFFARLLASFIKGMPTPGTLVGKNLVRIVGRSAALRLLKSMGWTDDENGCL